MGRKLLRSRAALAVLLLAVWSVAFATPCLPETFAAASESAQLDQNIPTDACDQHGRDYKVGASKAADDNRQFKLAALAGLPEPPLLATATLAGLEVCPDELVSEAGPPVYLVTARLRI
ncbi:hypothetical protein [Alkalilimnicola ehrlichii]|uniref:hypothetical protein n=1 Tax=Alkalilimnicola ehrlichii TaxID=351052 RepID=UPI0011C041F9|nr:hypothetical protein [Alkalilimnicola ehrlichii]